MGACCAGFCIGSRFGMEKPGAVCSLQGRGRMRQGALVGGLSVEIGGGRSKGPPSDGGAVRGVVVIDNDVFFFISFLLCLGVGARWVHGCLERISFRSRGRKGPGNVNKKGSAPRHCQPFSELLAIFIRIYIFTYLHIYICKYTFITHTYVNSEHNL